MPISLRQTNLECQFIRFNKFNRFGFVYSWFNFRWTSKWLFWSPTFEAWKPQGVPWRKPFNGVFREGVSRLKSSSFVGTLKGIDVFLLKKRCLKNDKCAKYLKYWKFLRKTFCYVRHFPWEARWCVAWGVMFEGEQETASLPGKRVRQGADEFGGEVKLKKLGKMKWCLKLWRIS